MKAVQQTRCATCEYEDCEDSVDALHANTRLFSEWTNRCTKGRGRQSVDLLQPARVSDQKTPARPLTRRSLEGQRTPETTKHSNSRVLLPMVVLSGSLSSRLIWWGFLLMGHAFEGNPTAVVRFVRVRLFCRKQLKSSCAR